HDLDQIAVEVAREEKRVAARRALRRTEALHAFADEVVVPLRGVAYIEADVRQPDAIPFHRLRRTLRRELEDLEHAAARHANPSDLAGGRSGVDAEKSTDALGRRVG